MGANLIG